MKQVKRPAGQEEWCVVTPAGSLVHNTVAQYKKDAMQRAHERLGLDKSGMRLLGFRLARCTITVDEPQAGRKGK
jgi:hypothetical protein